MPELVSVVVPVYNGAAFLESAVTVILAQRHRPLEIVVIDDGSTDDTAAVAERLQTAHGGDVLRSIRQENAGPSAARNRGLEMARGELIAFLDVDDLWPDGSLEARLEALRRAPEAGVASGRVRVVPASDPDAEGSVFAGPNLGASLFRRSVFDTVGGFDVTLSASEDVDWFLRARERSVTIVPVDAVTLVYRRHEANMTRQRSLADLQLTRALKLSLERRRQRHEGER